MKSPFLSLMSRMPLVRRWSLNRCAIPESLADHTLQVAMIAHLLGTIRNTQFPEQGQVEPDRLAAMALWHDAAEIYTQDVISPIKRASPELHESFKALERRAEALLLNTLPAALQPHYQQLLLHDEQEDEAQQLVKAADVLSAWIKCKEELRANNSEFRIAHDGFSATVADLAERSPEVRYFVEEFIPTFDASIEEVIEAMKLNRD